MTVQIATKIRRGLKGDFRDWVLVGQDAWWFYIAAEYDTGTSLVNISIRDDLKQIRIHSKVPDREWLYLDDVIPDTFKVFMKGDRLEIDGRDRDGDYISIWMTDPIDKTKEYV